MLKKDDKCLLINNRGTFYPINCIVRILNTASETIIGAPAYWIISWDNPDFQYKQIVKETQLQRKYEILLPLTKQFKLSK